MRRAHIEAWAPQFQFLVVEIAGRRMHVTPASNTGMNVRDASGTPVQMPVAIQLP
jgi:hypothetical protein